VKIFGAGWNFRLGWILKLLGQSGLILVEGLFNPGLISKIFLIVNNFK